ncbi:MAG: CocE/NonD family hydrolase [Arenicellales bacterium]
MQIVYNFPRPVRVIENVFIPLSDGSRLAARVWLPEDAESHPVPGILEAIPYRKRDYTRMRDGPIHHYVAGHGYACLRVDIRGSGDSDGLLADEYLQREQDDALEVIAWVAAQPWCDGSVGMTGISWGGFASLQVAARRPPALKAIITLCSSDDRFTDDAHYMGGCLINENMTWGSVLLCSNALPPDPEIVGERWKAMWLQRLQGSVAFPELWLHHPSRDEYWKHGSVCEDYGAIQCAVYAIGGWADAYRNAVPRLLESLRAPCKGLIGPWCHAFPNDSLPGPGIGYIKEALRWWDHWLRGIDTGIMDEPAYRVWMQEWVAPGFDPTERPGRWVAEDDWPSPRIETHRLFLNAGSPAAGPGAETIVAPSATRTTGLNAGSEKRDNSLNSGSLATSPEPETRFSLSSPQTTGLTAGEWCAFGSKRDLPGDQREDDARSLCFDSAPLAERTEILGAPTLELELSVDRPVALIAVRLNDVAPDGSALRVTYGVLNLTHRDGHEQPAPMVPGHRERLAIRLNDVAHAFPQGHKVRVSISTAYWPVTWPSPEPTTLTLYTGTGHLDLPVRPPRPEDAELPEFGPPEQAPAPESTPVSQFHGHRRTERDPATGDLVSTAYREGDGPGNAVLSHVPEINLDFGDAFRRTFRIRDDDPLSASCELIQQSVLRRDGWIAQVDCRTELTTDAETFRFKATLKATHNGKQIFTREWDRRVPRHLV